MLKIEINDTHVHSVQASGDMDDLLDSLEMAVNAIHTQLKRTDERAAKKFKMGMVMSVGNPYSLVWNMEAPIGECLTVVLDGKEKNDLVTRAFLTEQPQSDPKNDKPLPWYFTKKEKKLFAQMRAAKTLEELEAARKKIDEHLIKRDSIFSVIEKLGIVVAIGLLAARFILY